MKILQVFNRYLEIGGEEIWTQEFKKLAGKNHDVQDLLFDSRSWKEASALGRFKQTLLMWDNPSSRKKLSLEVQRTNPEVLLFHNILPVGSFGLYREASQLGLPILQYTHNFRPFSPSGTLWVNGQVRDDAIRGSMWREVVSGAWGGSRAKTLVMSFYLKAFIKTGLIDQVTHWLAISEFMRQQFVQAGIPPDRISTLRHCRPVSPQMGETNDQGYYLFLGRLVDGKGCFTIIEAWKNLLQQMGKSCPKLIVAGSGPAEQELRDLAGSHGKIEFAGYISGLEKEKLLRNCRAILAPSLYWEALGLIAYDGFEYGKPVLAARSGGLTEVIEESSGGFLHEPGNSTHLSEQVMEMEEMTPTFRQELGMLGRRWLVEEENPDKWRGQLTKILGVSA